MGIIVPRPATRAKEERTVTSALQLHLSLMTMIEESGVPREEASKIALAIVTTRFQRKQLWRSK